MFKASELVKFCISMIGMPYWYGCVVYKCTEDRLKAKSKQYPDHYGSSRMSKYRDAIKKKLVCMDCVGMIKGFFWTNGGVDVVEYINGKVDDFTNKYQSNGVPDKSADGMLSWCKSNGAKHGGISELPDVPGVLLFSPGHVGVYIGDGYAVEARGFNYGVVKTKVSARSWKEWAYMPASVLEYDGGGSMETAPESSEKTYKLGERIIKRNTAGDDVAELQRCLIKLGYNLGTYGSNKDGVDGDCGSKTVNAIEDFQKKHGLEADGEYGKNTHAKMQEVLAGVDIGKSDLFEIKVVGGKVNVRTAPNTSTGKIQYVVKAGSILKATAVDKSTGWYRLEDGNYISCKYTVKVK